MVFSSHLFVYYFLPVVLAAYYVTPRRGRHLVLTLASYAFYGWANPLFVLLMLASTTIDYFCGLALMNQWDRAAWRRPAPRLPPLQPERTSKRRWYYWLLLPAVASWLRRPTVGRNRVQKWAVLISITSNLALLGFFKYFNFTVANYNAMAGALEQWTGVGSLTIGTVLVVTLPLGISFYTFQSMSYSIDVYRGDAEGIRNPIDFACYVSMFPQLVAGPIIRFQEVADQLRERSHTMEKFARGVSFFSLGMAKKILIANPCGKIADTAFGAPDLGVLGSWWGVLAYSFQIYFDFSGYSDMAIGLGLMLGFVFPKNFDSPYRSASITEFWRRWHISLSTWLRDYLYIPLGGNRLGERATYVNLMIVMLLGGLWHGASWNFVIWGAIHGTMLGLERRRGKSSAYASWPHALRIAATFILVLFTWVFFRASDLPTAIGYLGAMFGLNGILASGSAALVGGLIYQPYYVLTMAAAAVLTWGAPQTWDFTIRIRWRQAVTVCAVLIVSLLVLATQAYNPFIYFIF